MRKPTELSPHPDAGLPLTDDEIEAGGEGAALETGHQRMNRMMGKPDAVGRQLSVR